MLTEGVLLPKRWINTIAVDHMISSREEHLVLPQKIEVAMTKI